MGSLHWKVNGKNIKPVKVRNFQVNFITELCSIERAQPTCLVLAPQLHSDGSLQHFLGALFYSLQPVSSFHRAGRSEGRQAITHPRLQDPLGLVVESLRVGSSLSVGLPLGSDSFILP